ncbi:MAG: energy transducer TonB [Bacteroidia bacterium]|nr:energy transducer TonB [Bacteroidia bacterium]
MPIILILLGLMLFTGNVTYAQVPINENVEALPPPSSSESDTIYQHPEQEAEFPGGKSSMIKYIAKNLVYPEDAVINGISGSIQVFFIVEKDGQVSHVELAKPNQDKQLSKEALRIVKMFPKFLPARQNGRPVRSSIVLPINFLLK